MTDPSSLSRKLQLTRPLVVFDIEATGMQISKDRIVEISMLKVMPDGTSASKTLRINPGIPMPAEVIKIHGITDEDLKDAPSFADVAEELKDWLHNCDLAGYNSNRFDIPMLVEEFLRCGVGFDEDRRYIDVQRIFMIMEKRTLEAALKFFCNKELENAHSAEADTMATWDVLQAQLVRYADVLKTDVDSLAEFCADVKSVDFERRMIWKDDVEVFNFGKHKGRPVEEVLAAEPSYYDWMQKGNFSLHTKLQLKYIKLRMQTKAGQD